jgi:aspartyl protease family protein
MDRPQPQRDRLKPKGFSRLLRLSLLLVLSLPGAISAPAAPLDPQIEYQGGGLSVDLHDEEILKVLDSLTFKTGVEFRIDPNIGGRISERFSGLPLEEGLRRILSGYNHVFVYGATTDTAVSRVMILGTGPENLSLPSAEVPEPVEPEVVIIDNPNLNPKRELVLKRHKSGHYFARGLINGIPADFLVDTGATTVALPARLATRAGLREGDLRYAETANGRTTVRRTQISELKIGDLRLESVDADIVTELNPGYALLGMSFLSAFDLEQRDDLLIIRER